MPSTNAPMDVLLSSSSEDDQGMVRGVRCWVAYHTVGRTPQLSEFIGSQQEIASVLCVCVCVCV